MIRLFPNPLIVLLKHYDYRYACYFVIRFLCFSSRVNEYHKPCNKILSENILGKHISNFTKTSFAMDTICMVGHLFRGSPSIFYLKIWDGSRRVLSISVVCFTVPVSYSRFPLKTRVTLNCLTHPPAFTTEKKKTILPIKKQRFSKQLLHS